MIKGVVLAMVLAPFVVMAEQAVELQNKAYWICKNQKQVRTIRVEVKDGTCYTYYSKSGEEKVVGSGRNVGSCENFLMNIKGNLEKSNWTCRDISSASITASAPEKSQ